jgi:uncharacterized membrane protein
MGTSDTARLEAFSDGVFAIAITLLVLEIKAPSAIELMRGGGLWPALAQRWTEYVGYVMSFLIIGIMWANHHALFQYIRCVDRPLMLANLLLLMGVGFLPFPTAILAEHLTDPAARTQATVFYGAALIFTSLTFNLVWWTGRWRGRLLGAAFDARGLKTITRRYAFGPMSYVLATGLAFVNVWLSLGVHLAVALWNARSEQPRPPMALPG